MSVYQQSPLVDAWAGGISEILVAESDDAVEDKSSQDTTAVVAAVVAAVFHSGMETAFAYVIAEVAGN